MRYENESFDSVTMQLDENEFIDCTFKDCELVYAGGAFKLEPADLSGIAIKFEGPAGNAFKLFTLMQNHAVANLSDGSFLRLGDRAFKLTVVPLSEVPEVQ